MLPIIDLGVCLLGSNLLLKVSSLKFVAFLLRVAGHKTMESHTRLSFGGATSFENRLGLLYIFGRKHLAQVSKEMLFPEKCPHSFLVLGYCHTALASLVRSGVLQII